LELDRNGYSGASRRPRCSAVTSFELSDRLGEEPSVASYRGLQLLLPSRMHPSKMLKLARETVPQCREKSAVRELLRSSLSAVACELSTGLLRHHCSARAASQVPQQPQWLSTLSRALAEA